VTKLIEEEEKKNVRLFFLSLELLHQAVMLLRIISSRKFLLLTIFNLIGFSFIVQLQFNDKLIDKKKISTSKLIGFNSPVYNELIELQFPFLKLVIKNKNCAIIKEALYV
jgi:hypothetical protein